MSAGKGWISVKYKLPKLNRPVMVCRRSGYDGSPLYSFGARIYDSYGWLWGVTSKGGYITPGEDAAFNDIEAGDDYEITHWRPLPPPPFKKPAGAEGKVT